MTAKWYSWHLSYRWGKTPKNLTQATCPYRGSNPGALRDRRACCRLLHSDGLINYLTHKIKPWPVGRELAVDHIHTFLNTQGHGGPPQMSDQFNAGVTSDTTRTLKTIHIIHTHIQSNKVGMRRMIMLAKWYSGTDVLPDICLTGEEKPRKNLTQETCPDRGSNPDPLRDRHACYRLLHSGEPKLIQISNITSHLPQIVKNVHT